MSVTVHIPGPLRDFSQQRGEVQLPGSPATLLEALQLLWATYPGLRDRILTEEGQLREHINIFVGHESIRYTGGLATPLPAKAIISIIPAISGGSARSSSTDLAPVAPRCDAHRHLRSARKGNFPQKILGVSL